MTPREKTEIVVQFMAAASPWWLLLLVPAAVAAGWLLYRVDLPGLSRAATMGLVTLRCLLLALLVFLAFRPNLIHRRTLTYPGRVVFVADNSLSMTARDTGASNAEALRVARSLGRFKSDSQTAAEPLVRMADGLDTAIGQLRRFQRFARGADRSQNAFWDRAAETEANLADCFDRLDDSAPAAERLLEEAVEQDAIDNAVSGPASHICKRLHVVVEQCASIRDGLPRLFSGQQSPGAEAYAAFYTRADAAVKELRQLQAELDAREVEDSGPVRAAAERVRTTARLELLREKLRRSEPALAEQLPDQGFQLVDLMSGESQTFDSAAVDALQPAPGSTDLTARLQSLLDEPSDFPLSALVVLSDGRDVAGRSPAALQRALAEKQVPLFAAMVGRAVEPKDLAVVDVVVPPIAVAGTATNARVRVKASIDSPVEARFTIDRDGRSVATREAELAPSSEQWIDLSLTPEETGVFRYTLRAEPIEGEVFPVENNSTDFVLNVRPRKVNVLLVDYAPRWQTRFVLNVLRRLPYVELSEIIVLTQPEAKLVRGAERGTWPASPAALSMYDVVVLGDLPSGLLEPEERAALKNWIAEGGGTLCLLSPRGNAADAGNALPGEMPDAELWPFAAGDSVITPIGSLPAGPLQRLEQLRLTSAGGVHPLTAGLSERVRRIAGNHAPERSHVRGVSLRPMAESLLTADQPAANRSRHVPPGADLHPAREDYDAPEDSGGRPLLIWQVVGRGKVLLLDTDRLWMALNPTALSAHAEVFVRLVSWAVEARWDGDTSKPPSAVQGDTGEAAGQEAKRPQLLLERRCLAAGSAVRVLGRDLSGGAVVEAVADGDVFDEAPAEAIRPDAELAAAVFGKLPAGEVAFRFHGAGNVNTPKLYVIAREPELNYLARDDTLLAGFAEASGGAVRNFDRVERLLLDVEPRQRLERRERLWQLWASPYLLAVLVSILTIEWVWRKFAGRV